MGKIIASLALVVLAGVCWLMFVVTCDPANPSNVCSALLLAGAVSGTLLAVSLLLWWQPRNDGDHRVT